MRVEDQGRTEAGKETGRIEAFSDGVFAVAITLLALELRIPRPADLPAGAGLLGALLDQWPAYVAYVVSFVFILIMWINHHILFTHIARNDHLFLLFNGLLLMLVTLVPFSSGLLADYIEHPDRRVAAVVYSGIFLLIAVVFNLLWLYAARDNRLLDRRADPRAVEEITRAYRFGPLLYFVAFALAFVSVAASVGLSFLLALYFALPRASSRVRRVGS